MTFVQESLETRGRRRFVVSVETRGEAVREAQALRWQVFAEEGGAHIDTIEPGLDVDAFDAHCAHVLVRDTAQDRVIGTYRILTGAASLHTGGFYSETEFDLSRLEHLRPRIAELGRSCVHRKFRNGAVIALLWSAISDYIATQGCDILIGCASVSMSDGGHNSARLYHRMRTDHLAPVDCRVTPRAPVNLDGLDEMATPDIPPLVKGYIRAGAWVCGAPHWDPDFNTADFMMMLNLGQLDPRYARHYGQGQ